MTQCFTEKEKELLINFFILKKRECKKEFVEYVNNIYKEKALLQGKDIEVDSYHQEDFRIIKSNHFDKLWDEKTGDNLVSFLIKAPKFQFSNNNIKILDKLNIHWNHINNEGNNILHLLVLTDKPNNINNVRYLDFFIKEKRVNPHIQNKNGDYFTNILFIPKKHTFYESKGSGLHMINYLDIIEKKYNFFLTYQEHFDNLNIVKINKCLEDINTYNQNYSEYMKKFVENNNTNVSQNYYYNLISEGHPKIMSDIYNILLSYKLSKELPCKASVKAKSKI